MTKTAQCPNCHAVNSFKVANCLDCRQPLPWADAVQGFQQQIATVQQRLDATQQQLQHVQQAPPVRPVVAPVAPPGEVLPLNVFHVFADAFMGKASAGLEYLDKNTAAWIGFICAVAYNICVVVGGVLILRHLFASIFGAFPVPQPSLVPGVPQPAPAMPSISPVQVMKLMVIAFTPWLTMTLFCALARKVFGGTERHIQGDVFIAGVSLLPAGFLVLLIGAIGINHMKILTVAAIFMLCYTILLIYRGLSTISGIRDAAAAVCTPLVLLLSGALAQQVYSRIGLY